MFSLPKPAASPTVSCLPEVFSRDDERVRHYRCLEELLKAFADYSPNRLAFQNSTPVDLIRFVCAGARKRIALIEPTGGLIVVARSMYYMSDGPGTAVFGCQRTGPQRRDGAGLRSGRATSRSRFVAEF